MVHKVPCWALELKRGSSVVETLWLAVTPDFRIMRRDLAAGSALLKQLTIDYEERADTGFACKAWSFIRFLEDGRISESSVVSNAVASVNPSIASSEFDFQFPPGTLVRLERSKKWAVARRDGTLRPVSEGELSAGISLVTLMETPPLPETTVGHASKLSTFRILVIVVAGCVLLLWWRCRRKTEA